MPLIDLKHTRFYIRDRATNWIELRVGEGDLTYTAARNIETDKNRGGLSRVREGEKEPVKVNFQFNWTYLRGNSGDPPSIEDVLYHENEAADWVSAATDLVDGLTDLNAPFSVHIQIVFTQTCIASDGTTFNTGEQIVLPEFNFQELSHSIKDATVSCSGICNRDVALKQRV